MRQRWWAHTSQGSALPAVVCAHVCVFEDAGKCRDCAKSQHLRPWVNNGTLAAMSSVPCALVSAVPMGDYFEQQQPRGDVCSAPFQSDFHSLENFFLSPAAFLHLGVKCQSNVPCRNPKVNSKSMYSMACS